MEIYPTVDFIIEIIKAISHLSSNSTIIIKETIEILNSLLENDSRELIKITCIQELRRLSKIISSFYVIELYRMDVVIDLFKKNDVSDQLQYEIFLYLLDFSNNLIFAKEYFDKDLIMVSIKLKKNIKEYLDDEKMKFFLISLNIILNYSKYHQTPIFKNIIEGKNINK
jgi:hypothetical protein